VRVRVRVSGESELIQRAKRASGESGAERAEQRERSGERELRERESPALANTCFGASDPKEFNCACYKNCTCKFKHGKNGKCWCVDDKNPVCTRVCVCVCARARACVCVSREK